ncbi:hypothetical protein Zm00014a_024813 [Zea mays]|uniref:Oxidative stress 3 n=2 Tax=Zea mays TaxID=4577 RepID=B6SPZ1_MAIZE|nr:hypothetical protein [Zea mays]PWZ32246.1 hypothetical protein Zm00014a_024813 [Zea mays]|eukprot:NP_001142820.1 uncharacterized LOC100275200 [Zea mays]
MGGFSLSGATGLAAYREEEDEELFETSSSISGDSDDEGHQLSDGEGGAYDLSSVMAQLPVKKGLSRYYDGKSQSFACMSEVRCLEDLRKKETPYKKIKTSRSSVALDEEQDCHTPGRTNSSRAPGSCCANLVARNNGKNMLYRPPPVPVNKSGYRQ